MFEAQFNRVQCEPWCSATIQHGFLTERAEILFVAADRMPRFRHVNADLVRAAGFESALDQRVTANKFNRANVCDGSLTLIRFGDAPSLAVTTITDQPRLDGLFGNLTLHDGDVRAFDGVLAKLFDK